MQNSVTTRKNNDSVPATNYGFSKDWGNLFNGMLNNWLDFPYDQSQSKSLDPKVEVSETENGVAVTAEIPGINKEDIDLEISADGYLTLSGEKKEEKKHNTKGNYISEISYGYFKRTIPLPMDLQFNEAQADFKNGVLSVSIPKSQEAKGRKKKIAISERK